MSLSSLSARLLTCVSCLAFPLSVYAQDPTIEVGRVKVDSPLKNAGFDDVSNPFGGSLTVPSVVQKQQELSRVSGAVALVPAEKYQNTAATTLKDVLGATPGVFVQQRYGEEMRLSIRGSGLSRGFHLRGITLLQDGVPINLADEGGDFQELDPLTARMVEVYKGGNGWAYGASSLGGAINFITPTGHTAAHENNFRAEAGSYDFYRTHASMARVIGKTDFYGAFTGMASQGWRDQSAQKKGRFNGNVGVRLSDHAETRFYLTYNNLNQEVPGTLTLRQALDTPRMAPSINRTNDYQRDIRSVRMANKTTVTIGDKTIESGLYASFKSLFHPIIVTIDQDSQDYGAFTTLKGRYELGGHRNDYKMGLYGKTGKIDARTFTNVGGSRGVQTSNSNQKAAQVNLALENQFYARNDVALVTGGQLVYAFRDFENLLNPAANETTTFNAFNPKLGAIWDVTRAQQVFANVTRSSEAPTYSELVQTPIVGFVPLEQQTAWTAEIGTRGSFDVWTWDAALYHANVKNELLNFTPGPGIPASTFNADDTIHRGVELGLDWDIGRTVQSPARFVLRQVYNLNDFRFDSDRQFGDNRIAGVPMHQYTAELHVGPRDKKWEIVPKAELVPDGGYIDQANTFSAPGYAVFHASGSYQIKDGVELFVDARNLLDKRYVSNYSTITNAATANTAVFYPGEGRSVFAGVRVGF